MILKGEKGLDKVDELFLANKDAEYADTYAAIMAIRIHGSETDVVPRKRLVKSLRHMLDRPELADLVIPDLARWEDWEVLPRLTDLFVSADENSSWVRVPVINYLRACPLPIAAKKIEELKLVDPDAVKRAMTFFPLSTDSQKSDADGKKDDTEATVEQTSLNEFQQQQLQKNDGLKDLSEQPLPPEASDVETFANTLTFPGSETGNVGSDIANSEGDAGEVASTKTQTLMSPAKARAKQPEALTSIETPANLDEVELGEEKGANIWMLFGVTLVGGCLCMVAMRSILVVDSRS